MQYRQRWLLVFNLCDKGKFIVIIQIPVKTRNKKPHPALLEAMYYWDEGV